MNESREQIRYVNTKIVVDDTNIECQGLNIKLHEIWDHDSRHLQNRNGTKRILQIQKNTSQPRH